MGPFRQSDAVLTVAQDNTRHAIEVTAANDAAGNVIGYPKEELKGKALQEIVSEKVAEAIEDYVEFQAGANDVGDVLKKIRDFQLKHRDGKPLPFKLKIVRHNSQQHDEFLLILHNEEALRQNDAFLAALRANFEGHTAQNPETGLPDRASFLKGVELARLHLEQLEKGVSVAVVQFDGFESILSKHGIQACNQWLKAIANLISQNLRGSDVVAHVERNRLALLLVGAAKDPAQMVLNRLRWLIAGHAVSLEQGTNVQSSVTIFFHELTTADDAGKLFEQFERTFAEKPAESTNLVAYI